MPTTTGGLRSAPSEDLYRYSNLDAAFEPDSGFLFDMTDDFSHFEQDSPNSGMQQATSQFQAFDMFPTDHGSMSVMDSSQPMHPSDFMYNQSQLGQVTPTANWNRGNPFQVQSTQDRLLVERNDSAMHFGQVTPPDDDKTSDKTSVAGLEASALSQQFALDAANAKSERARNAANQRHARNNKPKAERANLQEEESTAEEDEATEKREKYREKNRVAAAKCRAKKKLNTGDLEAQARSIQGRNKDLKEEALQLRDELSFLRNCALEHLAGGCQDNGLKVYNQMKVDQAARLRHSDASGLFASQLENVSTAPSPAESEAMSKFLGEQDVFPDEPSSFADDHQQPIAPFTSGTALDTFPAHSRTSQNGIRPI